MHAGHAYAGCTHKYRNAQTLDTFVHVEQGRQTRQSTSAQCHADSHIRTYEITDTDTQTHTYTPSGFHDFDNCCMKLPACP